MIEVLKHIPWWTYVIFAALLFIGIRGFKKRSYSIQQLFLIPFFLLILSLIWLSEINFVHSFIWIGGIVIGLFIGWWMVRNIQVKIVDYLSFELPGTYSSFIFILAFIAFHFFYLFTHKLQPNAIHYIMINFFAHGVLVGIFIGRAIHLYVKYKRQHD